MSTTIPGPFEPAEIRRFLDSYLYRPEAFFIDEVLCLDREALRVEAVMNTDRDLPLSNLQRTGPHHPAHVSGPELLMVTGSLACLHGWFFHGCRWDEGWAAYGSRIHRADFRSLVRIGPPLHLESRETRTRVGPRRVVTRCEIRFHQEDTLVYRGDQTVFFVRSGSAGIG